MFSPKPLQSTSCPETARGFSPAQICTWTLCPLPDPTPAARLPCPPRSGARNSGDEPPNSGSLFRRLQWILPAGGRPRFAASAPGTLERGIPPSQVHALIPAALLWTIPGLRRRPRPLTPPLAVTERVGPPLGALCRQLFSAKVRTWLLLATRRSAGRLSCRSGLRRRAPRPLALSALTLAPCPG